MAREIFRFSSPLPQQQIFDAFIRYFQSEGFAAHTEDGEQCMKKGVGLATAPQFVKITALNGVYTMEAWIKYAVLPGVYAGEMDLKGFVASIPKGQLKKRVNAFLPQVQAQLLQ